MNNITKWMQSLTPELFRDFIMIRDYECKDCPAKDYCHADDDDKCCEEEFYKWAMEGGEE